MMDSGLVRNMYSTLSNKSEKLCVSLAFIIRIRVFNESLWQWLEFGEYDLETLSSIRHTFLNWLS